MNYGIQLLSGETRVISRTEFVTYLNKAARFYSRAARPTQRPLDGKEFNKPFLVEADVRPTARYFIETNTLTMLSLSDLRGWIEGLSRASAL